MNDYPDIKISFIGHIGGSDVGVDLTRYLINYAEVDIDASEADQYEKIRKWALKRIEKDYPSFLACWEDMKKGMEVPMPILLSIISEDSDYGNLVTWSQDYTIDSNARPIIKIDSDAEIKIMLSGSHITIGVSGKFSFIYGTGPIGITLGTEAKHVEVVYDDFPGFVMRLIFPYWVENKSRIKDIMSQVTTIPIHKTLYYYYRYKNMKPPIYFLAMMRYFFDVKARTKIDGFFVLVNDAYNDYKAMGIPDKGGAKESFAFFRKHYGNDLRRFSNDIETLKKIRQNIKFIPGPFGLQKDLDRAYNEFCNQYTKLLIGDNADEGEV